MKPSINVGQQREDAGERRGQRQAARPVPAADEVGRGDVAVRRGTASPAVTKCHKVSIMVRPGPAIGNALHTQKVNLLLLG
jgi:hypothetical protein